MDTSNFDTSKLKELSTGQQVAAGSGVVAFVATFLPWYGLSDQFLGGISIRGTEFAFGWLGMLLFVAAAALVVAPAFGKRIGNDQLQGEQIALIVAGLASILWVIRLIQVPGAVFDVLDRRFGLYVAVLAGAGVVAGVAMSMKERDIALPTVDNLKSLSNGVSTIDATDTPPPPGVPSTPPAPDTDPGGITRF